MKIIIEFQLFVAFFSLSLFLPSLFLFLSLSLSFDRQSEKKFRFHGIEKETQKFVHITFLYFRIKNTLTFP